MILIRISTIFAIVMLFIACGDATGETRLIKTGERRHNTDVYLQGEPAQSGRIILDANNGFFDKGSFTAVGAHPAPNAEEKALIHFHYNHLVATEKQSNGSAHWYLWIPSAGEVRAKVYLRVPESDIGIKWAVQIGDRTRTVTSTPSKESAPQEWNLEFTIQRPGTRSVSLRKVSGHHAATEIHRILLTGAAIEKASLVRTRWRPAAVHTQYSSSACPESKLWVMETQNVSDYDSYSPATTPFGYFGGSFLANRTASGNMNFSMWAANSKAKSAPPISQMPHLLATGNPTAEFGGFGHEGSGVKIRNWEPLAHHPTSIVQALRMEVSDQNLTYSGYVFDDRVNRWVLYAVGRRPVKEKGRANKRASGDNNLRIASFCEIPGAASRERTGDRQRIIRRRGWVLDENDCWHPIDRQTASIKAQDGPINKAIAADNGWFTMATGGIEMFDPKGTEVELPNPSKLLPPYLEPEVASQLFRYPARIGHHTTTSITSSSAIVRYELADVGKNATATLYYGPRDCLSFVARTELHATERKGVIDEVFAPDRVWAEALAPVAVQDGTNSFELMRLQPGADYHYRLLITNESGKIWSFQSGQFRTRVR